MNIYLYDGTFSSLIKLIYYLYNIKQIPKDIKNIDNYENNLLDYPINIKLNDDKSLIKFYNAIDKNIIKEIYYLYLSNYEFKELTIYYFLKNAIKYKQEINNMKNLNCVNRTLKYSHQVSHEAHKLKGFLRFKKMKNNFYYGVINPTNNVLEIIAVHFSKRMKNEAFIIKDDNRKIYALYDKKQIIYLKDKDIIKLNLELDKDEIVFEELWKSFFKTIAINERKNLKTQMNFMPKKYWDYILEMENEK